MSSFALNEFLNGYRSAYELRARNTVTGETRDLTVYADSGMAAYAEGFRRLDAESGDRSWCFDGFERREA